MGYIFRVGFLTPWGTVSLACTSDVWKLLVLIYIGVSNYNESRTVARVFCNSVVFLSLLSFLFLWGTIIIGKVAEHIVC